MALPISLRGVSGREVNPTSGSESPGPPWPALGRSVFESRHREPLRLALRAERRGGPLAQPLLAADASAILDRFPAPPYRDGLMRLLAPFRSRIQPRCLAPRPVSLPFSHALRRSMRDRCGRSGRAARSIVRGFGSSFGRSLRSSPVRRLPGRANGLPSAFDSTPGSAAGSRGLFVPGPNDVSPRPARSTSPLAAPLSLRIP